MVGFHGHPSDCSMFQPRRVKFASVIPFATDIFPDFFGELVGRGDGVEERRLAALARYDQGVEQFHRMRFSEARRFFLESLEEDPRDGPSKVYIAMCEHYETNPPPPDWGGVHLQATK